MALIQLNSVDEAVAALIVRNQIIAIHDLTYFYESYFFIQKMHNYQLSDSSHLRVSFSKSTI
jgi:hypothetical protein